MTARDAISPLNKVGEMPPVDTVRGDMHLLEVLPLLLDSPRRELGVDDGQERPVGIVDQASMLEALGRMIAARGDCSIVEMECAPSEYSASMIARAVEDVDVHLVDLLTAPGADGRLHVTLRVRCEDPTSVVHSLERYGYEISDVHGHVDVEQTAAIERLLELQALINV